MGTKAGLREDDAYLACLRSHGLAPITAQQGEKLAQDISAFAYLECDALTREGVRDVFDTAVRAAMAPPPDREMNASSCVML